MTEETLQPRPPPRDASADSFWYAIALWLALLALVGGAAILDSDGKSGGAMLALDAVEAVIVGAFAWRLRESLRPLFARSGLSRPIDVLILVATFTGLIWFEWAYIRGAKWLGFRYSSPAAEYAELGWQLWATLVHVAVLPAILEETAFRGVMQSGLEGVMSRRDALIVQAAMFSVLHLMPAIFVSHFVMGLALGFVRMRSRSIYPGMILHAAWNALVVLTS